MPACSFIQVAHRSDWETCKNYEYKSSKIIYEDEGHIGSDKILINDRNEEVSVEYGGRAFKVLGIALNERSVTARIFRAVIGIILAAATAGLSLCFEKGRDLFTRKYAVVISMPVPEEETYSNIASLTVLEDVNEYKNDSGYPPMKFYKVDFWRIRHLDMAENCVGHELSALEIRDIMERIPEENFHGTRSAFQNVRYPIIQHIIQKALTK